MMVVLLAGLILLSLMSPMVALMMGGGCLVGLGLRWALKNAKRAFDTSPPQKDEQEQAVQAPTPGGGCTLFTLLGWLFLAGVGGIAILGMLGKMSPHAPIERWVHPRYEASIVYAPDKRVWNLAEKMIFPGAALDELRQDYEKAIEVNASGNDADATLEKTVQELDAVMGRMGFSRKFLDQGCGYGRSRELDGRVSWYPLSKDHFYTLCPQGFRFIGRRVHIEPASGSGITIQAPRKLVLATVPKIHSSDVSLVDGTATDILTVSPIVPWDGKLEITLTSPLARNPVGEALLTVSIFSVTKWIVGIVSLLGAEDIKQRVLKPIAQAVIDRTGIARGMDRLRRRLKRPRTSRRKPRN